MHRVICFFDGLINTNIKMIHSKNPGILRAIEFKKELSHKCFDSAFKWEFSKKIIEIYLLLSLYKRNDELNQDKIQII